MTALAIAEGRFGSNVAGSMPSCWAVSFQLWSLTGEERFRERADAILASAAGMIAANAFGATLH